MKNEENDILLIKVQPRVSPIGVRENIRKAMARTAGQEAAQIKVDVHGGEVILEGHVRTWAERGDALRAAWSAPGVTHVINQIRVTPYAYA